MTGHRRVKDIEYDEDELYSDGSDAEYDASNPQEELTAEDKENFATLTPVVRVELDEAGLQASDREIQDALWNYFWDVGKSVTYLKNAKGARERKEESKKEKVKNKFDEAQEESARKAGGGSKPQKKSTNGINGLDKKVTGLALNSTTLDHPSPTPKERSRNMDVAKLWSESAATRRPAASFVVIGHVDHGKSTLMGRLLLDTGAVPQRDIDRFQKEASEQGKGSFALAWVMDTGLDERERGVTVDIAQHYFSTEKADFTILDAPGHRDFVPNMIGGAAMADLGVLVVDANQLESGLKGQTREHVLLARAIGLEKIVVAVNKMDCSTPLWDEALFNSVSNQVYKLLVDTGFDRDNIKVVPCSGLQGDNVGSLPATEGPIAWVAKSRQTLIGALEDFASTTRTPPALIDKPLRIRITDIFHASSQHPISFSGRVEAGNLQPGESVVFMPSGESATTKALEVADQNAEYVVAGQIATLHLATEDVEALERNVRIGDVVCAPSDVVAVVTDFTAKISTYQPLLPGPVEVHVGRLQVPGRISGLLELVGKDGEVTKKKPRVVKPGLTVRVKITVEGGMPLDAGDRIVVRAVGETVGSGIVEVLGETRQPLAVS